MKSSCFAPTVSVGVVPPGHLTVAGQASVKLLAVFVTWMMIVWPALTLEKVKVEFAESVFVNVLLVDQSMFTAATAVGARVD